MWSRFFVALAVAVAVLLLPATATAEDDPPPALGILHVHSPSTLTTDGGSLLRLPPGYFLDEPTWDVLDTEITRLQDVETRLTAENEALRDAVSRSPLPGWRTLTLVGGALAAGIGIGVWASR